MTVNSPGSQVSSGQPSGRSSVGAVHFIAWGRLPRMLRAYPLAVMAFATLELCCAHQPAPARPPDPPPDPLESFTSQVRTIELDGKRIRFLATESAPSEAPEAPWLFVH